MSKNELKYELKDVDKAFSQSIINLSILFKSISKYNNPNFLEKSSK